MTWVIWFYGKISIRPVWNCYLVQERFLSIHKKSVRNLMKLEPHSDGLHDRPSRLMITIMTRGLIQIVARK